MNENNNMNVVDFNNLNNQVNNNQNMYQQTQTTNQNVPNMSMNQNSYNGIPNMSMNQNPYNGTPNMSMNQGQYNGTPNMYANQNPYSEVPNMGMNQNMYNEIPNNDYSKPNAVRVLDIEEDDIKTPSDVFGVNIPNEQLEQQQQEISQINQVPVEEEKPKYGYASNEKANLNADENANIKFIIFLAILMLGVIILLPYLSKFI